MVASFPSVKATALDKKLYRFPGVPSLSSDMALTLVKVTKISLFICFCCSIQTNKRYIT
jgi:hypothetical protein